MNQQSVTPSFCPRCGASIQPEAKFCHACGAPVQKSRVASESVGEEPSKSTNRKLGLGSYRYLYLYAAFWGFVTYSCATHAIAQMILFTHGAIPTETQTRAEFFTTLVLWPIATAVAAWVTYRLLSRRVSLNMIYVLVVVHAANVLAEGIIPWKVLLWIALGIPVILEARQRERESMNQAT